MLKDFYYLEGNKQKGPLSIEQLKSIGLKPDTLVWTQGLDDWKPAQEVIELKNLMTKISPTISSIPKRASVEEEYEDAIALYLNNGYMIVNQSADITILLSPKFQKEGGNTAFIGAMVGGPVMAMAGQIGHNSRQIQYQVTIRITKTGELQILGYTLDKQNKKSHGCLVTFIVILSILVFLFIIGLIGSNFR